MTYITSIGLDVHARSVSACAFDPFTGEVAQRRSGTDAGEIAEWIPGFESPKAVYVNVNPSFTDSTNAIAPIAPTHPRRFRRRQAPFPASRSGARSFVR